MGFKDIIINLIAGFLLINLIMGAISYWETGINPCTGKKK